MIKTMIERSGMTLFCLPDYIRPYPVLLFLSNMAQGLLAPVLIIFYRKNGINLFEIGLVSSIFEISMLLFEIPTGYVADIFGRKLSVLCSFASFAAAGVTFAIFKNLTGFVLASIIQGIGFTFISGALQAWAVEILKSNRQDSSIQNVFASGTQSRIAGFLAGSIFGGWLGLAKMNVVWMIYIGINMAALLYAFINMKERRCDERSESEGAQPETGIKRVFKTAFASSSDHFMTIIILLFAACIFYEFSMSPISEYWTVFFAEDLHMPELVFGWVIAVSSILLIVIIDPASKFLQTRVSNAGALVAINIMLMAVIFLFGVSFNPIMAIIVYIIYKILASIYEPIRDTFINAHIQDKYRATVLSVYNMAGSAGEVISGVGIGWVAQKFGIRASFYASGLSIFLVIIAFGYIISIYRKADLSSF
ncbi:MAG TPA: MFS transporter [Thermoanaerobacterales bacterium]|nr:MFS transporter [Thermoanaerobacterales bacterium]